MVAAVPYRVPDGEYRWQGSARGRDLLAAWLIALLLMVGAVISFALDHMVTVSPDPIATYGSALKDAEPNGQDEREVIDALR